MIEAFYVPGLWHGKHQQGNGEGYLGYAKGMLMFQGTGVIGIERTPFDIMQ